MNLYSFDPGKNIGVAEWTDLDEENLNEFKLPSYVGEFNKLGLFRFLGQIKAEVPTIFVCEDYKIRNNPKSRGFNHNWNSGDTLRIIGVLEYRADQLGIPFLLQQPNVRSIGAGYSGMPHDPNKHDKDHLSAMMHGYYHMVKNGKMKPRG